MRAFILSAVLVVSLTAPALAKPTYHSPDDVNGAYGRISHGPQCAQFDRRSNYAANHMRDNDALVGAIVTASVCIDELVGAGAPHDSLYFPHYVKQDMCFALDRNGMANALSECNEYY